jgi:hypothetical protein
MRAHIPGSEFGDEHHKVAAVIERLEFLLALARERHFGRAAQFCNVSQQIPGVHPGR